jgi:hypothetical protein
LTFAGLQTRANAERGAEWVQAATTKPGLEFNATIELGGEIGRTLEQSQEVSAIHVGGMAGACRSGNDASNPVADELGDVVICAESARQQARYLDLADCVRP